MKSSRSSRINTRPIQKNIQATCSNLSAQVTALSIERNKLADLAEDRKKAYDSLLQHNIDIEKDQY